MQTCKICGGIISKVYKVNERIINKGEVFNCGLCKECGTLQVLDEIKNIGDYYKENYYSYNMSEVSNHRSSIRTLIYDLIVAKFVKCDTIKRTSLFWKLWQSKIRNYMILSTTKVNKSSAILDVGCGDGHLIKRFRQCGFKNLTGIDAYGKEFPDDCGVKMKKCDLFDEHLEKYDLIIFNHAFEHMNNPKEILNRVCELLNEGGALCY